MTAERIKDLEERLDRENRRIIELLEASVEQDKELKAANARIAELEAQAAEMRQALKFYANRQNELQVTDDDDRDDGGAWGITAREALSTSAGRSMLEALDWYADEVNYKPGISPNHIYIPPEINRDRGQRARKVLGKEEK